MREDVKEVAETMSDYAKAEKEQLVKSIRNFSIIGLIAFIVYMALGKTGIYNTSSVLRVFCKISEALIYVTVVMFPLYTSGMLNRLRLKGIYPKFNNIPQPVLKAIAFVVLFAAIALIRIIITKVFGS